MKIQFTDQVLQEKSLPPDVLTSLIEEHVAIYCDGDLWDESIADEESQREDLRKLKM